MTLVIKRSVGIETEGHRSLGMNLSGLSDFDSPRFIDLAKHAEGWWYGTPGTWNTYTDPPQQSWTGDILDVSGGAVTTRSFIWKRNGDANTAYRGGTFRLTWDGSGTVTSNGGPVTGMSGNSSGLTFNLDGTQTYNCVFTFSGIDWANPPRNLKIIRTDLIAAHDAGAIYDPAVVADYSQFSCLRFMDWLGTNVGMAAHWADRKRPEHQQWAKWYGAPLEVCIDLCNQTGCDGWFNIPHMATDDYIRNFVQLVHDTLDPGLVAWFEFSNEMWNWSFYQTFYARRRAWDLWAPAGWTWSIDRTQLPRGPLFWQHWDRPDWQTASKPLYGDFTNDSLNYDPVYNGGYSLSGNAHLSWHGKRSTEMSRIVREIYGRTRRARTVLNIQTVSSVPTDSLIAPLWAASGDPAYVPPHTMHDAIAITGYFGHKVHETPGLWTTLSTQGEAAAKAMLLAACEADLVETRIPGWRKYKTAADGYGMDLVMYEGNYHMTLNSATGTDLYLDGALRPGVFDLFTNTAFSPEMAALQAQARNAFRDIGGQQYMAFIDIAKPTVFGWWGYRRWRTDASPNWTGIADWQANNPRWWIR